MSWLVDKLVWLPVNYLVRLISELCYFGMLALS
jgi:hypothetical protein